MTVRRLRVLLLAEAANPELTSVALIGWRMATALREVADLQVVTELRNRPAILAAGWREGEDFTAIDNRAAQGGAWRLAQALGARSGLAWSLTTGLATLAYPAFEAAVWARFRDRLRAGEFDLVHRLTPVTPNAPSPIAGHLARLGIPLVIGPVNGGLPWPGGFPELRGAERDRWSALRPLARLDPRLAATWRQAALVLVGSRQAGKDVRGAGRVAWAPENGVDPQVFVGPPPALRRAGEPLRCAFVGRLVPLKGVDLILAALAAVPGATLTVIGEGPERPRLEALAQDPALTGRVTFTGSLPHHQIAGTLQGHHLFAFPSLREFGGGAVAEAMACGLVPVVADYGGPPELVPEGCGLRLPMPERATLIAGLAAAISALADDDRRRLAMATAAHAHAHATLTWSGKARILARAWQALTAR
jgi:glycosyltransferase involved in cell wall biosynthesis